MNVDGKVQDEGTVGFPGPLNSDDVPDSRTPTPGGRPVVREPAPRLVGDPAKTLEERLRGRLGFTLEDAPPYLLEPSAVPLKPRTGCLVHQLTMKDRNLIIGACRAYCQKKGNKDIRNLNNLDRLIRLFNFQETLDFNALVGDVQAQMNREWAGAKMRYDRWRDWKAGLPTKVDTSFEGEDGAKTIIEPFVPSAPAPPKPPARPPELPKDEERGPVRSFNILARLDVWIQKALPVMEWNTVMTEDAVILCKLFNVGMRHQEEEGGEEAEDETAHSKDE